MSPTVRRLADLEGEPHANAFPDAEPKTIRLTLTAGESVPAHAHPGRRIVCHLLTGALELTLDGETYALEAGDVARFDGDQDIAPRALEDSTALLVLARAGPA